MTLKQLSVFLENRPGRISIPCRALAEAGLSIRTLSLADTQQFGILRLIVLDWERAKDILERAGCVVKVTEVVAVEVADRAGGLQEVLDVCDAAGLNIEYMYAFTFGRADRAVLVFCFEDPDAAVAALGNAGINVVGPVHLNGQQDPPA